MKAGNYYGGKDLRVEFIDDPTPGLGEVFIRVTAAGICGSDLHEYRNEYPAQGKLSGRIMGHELVGEIVGLGENVDNGLAIGKRIGVNPLEGCGHCERCRSGMSYLCLTGQTIGIHKPGGFAEFVCVSAANCIQLPEHLPDDAAVLLDVYACALHGVNRLPIKPGDRVVVIGTGAMAIAFAELSYLTGASAVAMIGRHTSAIERAANLVQAMPVSSAECDPVQAIKDWTQGRGADIVFECAGGIEQTLETAMEMASQGGSIGVEGVHTRPQTINSVNALLRELTITWFYSHGRRGEKTEYELALDLMAKQKIKPERLITHHFPLDRIQEAFFTADDHIQTGSIKVIINP